VKKILIAFIAFVVILWAPWIVFSPASLQFMIEDSFYSERIHVEMTGLEKGLFYTLSAEKVIIRSAGGELLVFDSVRSKINPLSLMMLKLRLTADGNIGGGTFSGNLRLGKGAGQMLFDVKQAEMNKIPLLKRTGVQGTGTISGRVSLMNDSVTIVFATDKVNFEPSLVAGITLPLNFFHRATGSLTAKGNILTIESVSLEGKDVFARLKGRIQNSLMDMTMEIMPGRTGIENPLFLAEFERYKVSPGYYAIPVRGNLSL
jgi:type II secretion system protein N